ncbi:MFS general substrate transporter [Annulohypoxylon maeteangense]|uniref:MFS general substrate transporter n=1 Tax=Annulohypoxylon maeteangense TaxID=1927788 RepID=UPI002007AAE8|nr:MFS general substrate transporter [Annulohypoxylon maeteangense]KAI0883059.1 MFS general substrate transporter [Annulohypoxylon maeteangense]
MTITNSPDENDINKADEVNSDPKQASASASEVTPLLAASPIATTADPSVASAVVGENEPLLSKPDEKELPKFQILLLCFGRMIEPIAFFSIFPYINQMVQDNGQLEEADVGFYAGFIESNFSLVQMLVMMFWGRAADRWGRKPVLVASLIGLSISTSLFGLSRTIWQMNLLRSLAGVFAGTIVTIRTMISEHSTAKTQAQAFSWFAFSGNVGMFIGPLLGGSLVDPAHQYPRVFGGVKFFEEYPYILPSIVAGCIGLATALVAALFVEETLKKDKRSHPKPNPTDDDDTEATAGAPKRAPMSTLELLNSPGVKIVLYNYSHVMLLGFAYTAIVPIFWFTNVKLGGFGFSPLQISLMLGLTGISQATWLLFIFPPLTNHLGTNGVLRAAGTAYPFFMVIMPFMNLILYQDTPAARTVFWIVMPILLVLGSGVSIAFTGVQLALNDVSPSPETLGMLNAMALTAMSGLRAFCPALFSSLFAVSVKKHLLWGYLVWLILALLAGGFTISSRFLPQTSEKGYERVATEPEQEDE